MQIDKTITRWSGPVATFVKTTIANIPFNDRVKFTAICQYGNMTDRQALDALSLNHYPTLDADAMREYGQYRPKYPDKIWISDRLCREFRRNPGDQGWQTLLEASILHELMHWGWRGEDEPSEMGEAFEMEVYKRVLTRESR